MTRWADEPESSADALIGSAMDELALTGAILLVETTSATQAMLTPRGLTAEIWRRRAGTEHAAAPEPPAGPFDGALLRLPKSRDEQRMATHQCLGVLAPQGRLIVYGGNDEGIRSYQKMLAELGPIETRAARGHGRILQLRRADVTAPLRPRLRDWRDQHRGAEPSQTWLSYPGLFAAGAPDPGTTLLLTRLPKITEGTRILDYGCGPGAIAAAIRRVEPSAVLTLLDNDSVALAAALENVPDATQVLGCRLDAAGVQKFDLIVSNPPLHSGFRETLEPLLQLIADAPGHLTASGTLLIVVQRRIALDAALAASFGTVETMADDGRYRVWAATGKALKKPIVKSDRT